MLGVALMAYRYYVDSEFPLLDFQQISGNPTYQISVENSSFLHIASSKNPQKISVYISRERTSDCGHFALLFASIGSVSLENEYKTYSPCSLCSISLFCPCLSSAPNLEYQPCRTWKTRFVLVLQAH